MTRTCLPVPPELADSSTLRFQRNTKFLLRLIIKILYCGELPWPKDIVLCLGDHQGWLLPCHQLLTYISFVLYPSVYCRITFSSQSYWDGIWVSTKASIAEQWTTGSNYLRHQVLFKWTWIISYLGLYFCHDIAMTVQKAIWSKIHSSIHHSSSKCNNAIAIRHATKDAMTDAKIAWPSTHQRDDQRATRGENVKV